MRWLYLIEIAYKNIDTFNISIVTGIITGWFVVLLDSNLQDIRTKRTGFINDRYRRYQNINRFRLTIIRIIETYRITEKFPAEQSGQRNLIMLLALDDARKEINMEIDILEPYYYFREEYLTENMKNIIGRETNSFIKIKDLINIKDIEELNLQELDEQKTILWKIAFDMRKEPREKVKFEVLKTILQDKAILMIIIIATIAIIIG